MHAKDIEGNIVEIKLHYHWFIKKNEIKNLITLRNKTVKQVAIYYLLKML